MEEDDTHYIIFIGVFIIIGGLIVLIICIMYIKLIIIQNRVEV